MLTLPESQQSLVHQFHVGEGHQHERVQVELHIHQEDIGKMEGRGAEHEKQAHPPKEQLFLRFNHLILINENQLVRHPLAH